MTPPLAVLLVEDSPSDAKLLEHALRATGRELRVERVEEAEAMRAALATGQFDLVISDWSMPKFSALAALHELQTSGLDLPFIIASGAIGDEAAVDAMRAGAHDYVLKDRLARLAPAVERELRERDARAARRAADEALRRQSARFRALIERSADGVTLGDAGGRFLYMSPGAREILGVGEQSAHEIVAAKVIHPDDRAMAAELQARALARPSEPCTAELRARRPDGTVRWIELTLVNRLDDAIVGAMVANFRDVTDRRAAQEELCESELRFRRLWDSGLVGISIADASGAFVDANDALLDILGYTRADLASCALTWQEMTPPEWREAGAQAAAQLALHGEAKPWMKEYTRKDGSRASVLVGVATLSGSRNISVTVDLSAQTAAEEDHRRAEIALRATEAQLRQAQKMEAIGRLAGGVAHDFNNMLSVILSYSELISGDLMDGDPLKDDIREICKAGRRAADLTSQLLVFSRQQQIVAPRIVDLNDVLASTERMLRRVLGEDIDLVCVPTVPLGNVRIDRTCAEQVVMNLAVNARDAMPTGGQLTIETGEVTLDEEFARNHMGVTPGRHVALVMTDTGIGMDPATQARIFEPFFTTKGVGRGTGLGLSTVFGIVQQGGGTVWVYSELGKGTAFKVYLPRVDGAVSVERTTTAPTANLGGSETVLLVEDEDAVRAIVHSVLVKAGYKVIEARNAGEALLHVEGDPSAIDLLLTDVVLPQMSGPALAARLRQVAPAMKVLCMSGYTDDSVVRHGLLDASHAFLQKPITPGALRRKVREVLDAPPESADVVPDVGDR